MSELNNFGNLKKGDLIKRIKVNKNYEFEQEDFILCDKLLGEEKIYATLQNKKLGYFYKVSFPMLLSTCIDVEEMFIYTVLEKIDSSFKIIFLKELECFYFQKYAKLFEESEKILKKAENIKKIIIETKELSLTKLVGKYAYE